VIDTSHKCLGVDPPDDGLDLLRLTDGVLGGMSHALEDITSVHRSPFSNWKLVEAEMNGIVSDREREPPTESGVPYEIQRAFDWTSPKPENFTLRGGFRCGMIGNEGAPEVAMLYLHGEYTNTEADSSPSKDSVRWRLVGNMTSRNGYYEPSPNIGAALQSWADTYL
jgi:hypothetical protein